MLSAADRDQVQQARAHVGGTSLCNSRPEVWERWDVALGMALAQTGSPLRIHAEDWEL